MGVIMREYENRYDEWIARVETDKVFCECEHCSEGIYMGECYIETNEGNVHEECYREFAKEMLDYREKEAGLEW